MKIKETLNISKQFLSYQCRNRVFCRPQVVSIITNHTCNIKCAYCSNWRLPAEELSFENAQRTVHKLMQWLGVFKVRLGGRGEPFMWADMVGFVKWIKNQGLPVSINTNGILLSDAMIGQMPLNVEDEVSFALDGIKSQTHDGLRQSKGSLTQIMRALDMLSPQTQVAAHTIILEQNFEELVDLLEFSHSRGVGMRVIPYYFYDHALYQSEQLKKDPFWPKDFKRLSAVLEALVLKKKRGYSLRNSISDLRRIMSYYKDPVAYFANSGVCRVGYTHFTVFPSGDVRFCNRSQIIGNILDQNPADIWNSSLAMGERGAAKDCEFNCDHSKKVPNIDAFSWLRR